VIGIFDPKVGNLASVANSVYELGFDPIIVNNQSQFSDITHLILPGVGSFQKAADYINSIGNIKKFLDERKIPVMGICLGMQLMGKNSEEGLGLGLSVVNDTVHKLSDNNIRVPHIGWNTVTEKQQHPIMTGIKHDRDFYFVHSYAFTNVDASWVVATSTHGQEFASIIAHNNYVGVQFHPEKSQSNGLRLIENFCLWSGVWNEDD
jgi:imidazole glycerol-phosphate synthase subunit HisH